MAQPPAPHIAPTQHELAKTSVGDYTAPSAYPPGFLNAARAGIAQYSDDPLGITATQNLSYRDAVLRMLASSQRLVSYIRNWHMGKDEPAGQTAHAQNLLDRFDTFARYVEGEIPGYVPIGAHARQGAVDATVDDIWDLCNDFAVDIQPAIVVRVPLDGGPYWNWNRSRSASHDAHEWLLWLMNAMHEQLRRFDIENYVPYDAFQLLTRTKLLSHWVCTHCNFVVRRREDGGGNDVASIEVKFSKRQSAQTFEALRAPLSLEDLIRKTFVRRIRDQCPRCNTTHRKSGYTTIRSTPEILFVKLNRAITRENSNRTYKTFQSVKVPEYLDLTPWLVPQEFGVGSIAKYRLSALVSHTGDDMSAGNNVCFARLGKYYNTWFKFDGANRTACEPSDFDDSTTNTMSERTFADRETPYVMMYELDYRKSRKTDGRISMNLWQGGNQDIRPNTWYTGRNAHTRLPPVRDLRGDQDEIFNRVMPAEITHPPAELHMSVRIGDETLNLPRCFIEHFNIETRRRVELKATLVGEDANGQRKEMDLAKAYSDAEEARRRLLANGQRTAAIRHAPGTWYGPRGRWKISKR